MHTHTHAHTHINRVAYFNPIHTFVSPSSPSGCGEGDEFSRRLAEGPDVGAERTGVGARGPDVGAGRTGVGARGPDVGAGRTGVGARGPDVAGEDLVSTDRNGDSCVSEVRSGGGDDEGYSP